jgi:AraC-like DNA-binding protein
MAGSLHFRYNSPEAYQAAIRPAQVELLVTAKGDFHAGLTRIEFPRVWAQQGRESLPRVANSAASADRPPIFFLARANQASIGHSGRDLAFGEIAVVGSGSMNHHRSEGPCHWATLSVTDDDLTTASHALVGRDLINRLHTHYLRPPLREMRRLLSLHESVGHLVEGAPDILAQPEPTRALEQALLHAMIMCLNDGNPVQMSSGALRHNAIIGRFEELLTANYDRPLYLGEICAAIGVSERTLRVSCMEHLGMGPVRYLWLRRMHLARRALLLTAPGTVTVTSVATANGFWELGRFAVEYRALFGEAPSASLRRTAEEMRTSKNSPFAFADSEYA